MDSTRFSSLQSRAASDEWNAIYHRLKAQAGLAGDFDYGVEAWHFALGYVVIPCHEPRRPSP